MVRVLSRQLSRVARTGVAIACMVVVGAGLSGCMTRTISRFDLNGNVNELVWPQPQKAHRPEGRFATPEVSQALGAGTTRDQVRDALGPPHFREGFHAYEWDYLLSLRQPIAGPPLCQLKTILSRAYHGAVQDIFWRNEACGRYFRAGESATAEGVASVPAVVANTSTGVAVTSVPNLPPVKSEVETKIWKLPTNTVFPFAQYSVSALDADARRVLEEYARELTDTFITKITVAGYADRFGSDEKNQRLSVRRAETVRDFIVGHGVVSTKVEIDGKGTSEPVVECSQSDRAALISCLSPNRRARLEVEMLIGT
jgi:OOP family OmpA-OmpF porin